MTHFEQELQALKDRLLTMAGYAEQAVRHSVRALSERDDALAERVKRDDDVLDRLEMEIDEEAIHLLAKAPLASDLRLITVAMKISHDLERVGDEATAIAKRALDLAAEPPLRLALDLPRLAALALQMLKDALDAFVQRDAVKARAIVPRDKQVDALHKEFQRLLAAHMTADPAAVNRCLNLLQVCKRLERIADHAANIAEEVVFLCEAEDIRHRGSVPGGGSGGV